MQLTRLDGYFEQVLSTDQIRTYKPDPKAYQLGVEFLKLKKEEVAWVNRQGLPAEELSVTPDGMGKGMDDLVNFVIRTISPDPRAS